MFSLNYGQIIHKQIMTKEQLNKELTAAAASGDAAGLRAALAAGAEVDARESVATALMIAARHGHAACVKLLLEAGADVHARAYGAGSLEWAAGGGYAECVKLLLAAGAVGEGGKWEEGCTEIDTHWVDEEIMWADEESISCSAALIWAVRYGHADCLRFLLEAGANPGACRYEYGDEGQSYSGLLVSAYYNHLDCMKLLYPVGRMPGNDAFMGNVLCWAADGGGADCLEWLLSPEVGEEYTALQLNIALQTAARHGYAACVKLLLEAGADLPNGKSLAYIYEELEYGGGHEDCLSLLRAAEAEEKHVLLKAAQRGDVGEVRRCLSAGADARAVERALFPASEGGHAACVKLLIAAGANPNAEDTDDKYGDSCLRLAVREGHTECVRLLLAAAADANAVAYGGQDSCLMLAAKRGDAECVKLLIDAGADVHFEDCEGYSIVMRAAEKGHMECLKLLFAAGASTRGLASVLRC